MRQTPDWLPYFAPMIAFALVLAAGNYLPEPSAFGLAAMKVLAPLLLFAYFQRRGCYPELGRFQLGAGNLADVAVGLAVAGVWMAPYVLWEGMRPEVRTAERN